MSKSEKEFESGFQLLLRASPEKGHFLSFKVCVSVTLGCLEHPAALVADTVIRTMWGGGYTGTAPLRGEPSRICPGLPRPRERKETRERGEHMNQLVLGSGLYTNLGRGTSTVRFGAPATLWLVY